jgi:hypothetical protein
MAAAPTNPNKVVATINGTQITCSTEAGAAYVKKVTHPPCVIPNEYCGIPDSASPNIVMMETKGEGNFPPIITYPITSSATLTANSQKMLFLSPSGSKVASYVFNYVYSTAGTGWVQAINFPANSTIYPAVSNICGVAQTNGGYNFANFSNDYTSIRSSYKSETFYLNATNFNDQGTVATAKFKPNIIHATSSVELLSLHKDCPRSQANLAKCLLSMGIKPKLNTSTGEYHIIGPNDDKLQSGDYPFDYAYQIIELDNISAQANNGGGAFPFVSSPMWAINSLLPATTTDVLNMSSKSSTRPARDGSFVVHQHVDDISSFVSNPSLNLTGGTLPPGALNGNVICLIRGLITGGSGNSVYAYAPLYSDPTYGSPSSSSYPYYQTMDTPWNNLDWSVTLFDGLTLPSTTGTTLSSVPYVTIKSYAGLEGQVSIYSSLRPFQRVLPPPDRLALDCATTIFHARPDDLPAAANDLASIGSTIVKFIPTAIEWIKDLFGKKKEAPPPPSPVKPKQPPVKRRSRSRTPQRQIQPQRIYYNSNVRPRSQAPIGQRQPMQQQEPVQQLPRSNGNGMGMPLPKAPQRQRRR